MGVSICIHRAAQEIGGNCIEIKASSGERLLLDAGRPLDTPDDEPAPIPVTLDTTKSISGILLSHAHADHSGLLETLPAEWPVYCGKPTESLLCLSAAMSRKPLAQACVHWESGKATNIGPFTVMPRLIDHSAFDAYALQIDVEGKTIVYSGDFRAHGRKAKLTEAIMRTPPKRVDALIMEGTNLPATGSATKPTPTEAELEDQFVSLFKECQGYIFVSWSATNIDRTVSLYRACKRSGRVLVPDLYCMLVLMRLKEFAKLPQPEWKCGHMRAVVTKKMMGLMERLGEPELIEYLIQHRAAMSADKLPATPEKWVIMARSSLVDNYREKGVVPTEDDTWVWSMWNGYLEQESTLPMRDFFAPCQKAYIHSSGHASLGILQKFAEAMQPKMLIPVHGEGWQTWAKHFPNVRTAANGEWLDLNAVSKRRHTLSLLAINKDLQKRGSRGYPKAMSYVATEMPDGSYELCIKDENVDSEIWGRADTWGIAAYDEVRNKITDKSLGLRFAMREPSKIDMAHYESFKRRLSYLAATNDFPISLNLNSKNEPLYPLEQLEKPLNYERIRTDFPERGDDDAEGKPEKDFQTYLFGKRRDNAKLGNRTNERLAIFGEDFRDIKRKKLLVQREWPTGVFRDQKKEDNRILPTEFIDFVTINNSGEIAIIELKFTDKPLLEVIAQIFNYALFFYSYKEQLSPLIQNKLKHECSKDNFKFKTYHVSHTFHRRFDAVWSYYIKGPIAMRQVVMGHYIPDQ